MVHRQIGQEVFAFVADPTPHRCSLDRLSELMEWSSLDRHLASLYAAAKGEASALRALARKSKDGPQARRLLALARFTREPPASRRRGSAE